MSSKRPAEADAIERVLDAFGDDLWLKRRSKIDEIVEKLEALKLTKSGSKADKLACKSGESRVGGSNLSSSIQEWIQFLQFLKSECTGEPGYDDRQWGQLMELMQISRKFNHRSVKFREIIKSRQAIEINAADIRLFNERARLGRIVEKSIETFEQHLAEVHLLLSPSGQKDTDQTDLVAVNNLQRSLDTTLRPVVNNLRSHLQAKLISEGAQFAAKRELWLQKLESFERTLGSLSEFVGRLAALKQELLHLRPLVDSLSCDTRNKINAGIGVLHQSLALNGDLLSNSLASCRENFKLVVEFERELDAQLRKCISPWHDRTGIITGSLKTHKDGAIRKLNDNQQVRLIRLLKQNKLDEFASDIYGNRLESCLVRARECRAILDKVLMNLRLEFGRFYFVNDVELLTIISLDSQLGACSNLAEHRRLISKLFNNSIERFILNSELNDDKPKQNTSLDLCGLQIVGVQTPIGEQILITGNQEPIPLMKRVNIYSLEIVRILNELMRKLQRSLRARLVASLNDDQYRNAIDWSLPVQLLELAERIKFTKQVESQLTPGKEEGLEGLLKDYEAVLLSLGRRQASIPGHATTPLIGELKRAAVVSLCVHFISTLIALIKSNVSTANDWHWLKLARYYLTNGVEPVSASDVGEGHQMVVMRLANSEFNYKFDLLPVECSALTATSKAATTISNQMPTIKRLVYTKTSERCFLAASQAVGRLKLGASPFGPAGSGKTETIKALGQLLGCQVIVHNCDETNDSQALERLIWGLAHTGLWGCFDEFNRLQTGALSSVSALLELVQSSLRANKTTLELNDGQMRSIDADSAFFITMNPSDGRKYRGRRRLPANLRSLFLAVAMVRVQIGAIVRELLLTFGVTTSAGAAYIDAMSAERIGAQVAAWIEWARANMQADCCEWDLRMVMTILHRFKASCLMDERGAAVDNFKRTSGHANWPILERKLVQSIEREVAPRLSGDEQIGLLSEGLRLVFKDAGARRGQPTNTALDQLEDQLEARPGVILLGPSRSGKSSLWRALLDKKNSKKECVGCFRLSQRSCSKADLFGGFSHANHDHLAGGAWSDGLMTRLVRRSLTLLNGNAKTDACLEQVWLILDGPLDPDWIESLNSALDDNQVLTLSSGERLNFVLSSSLGAPRQTRKCIKLIFETDDLSRASPATISRLGLVNLSASNRPIERRQGEPEAGASLVELMLYRVANASGVGQSGEIKRAVAHTCLANTCQVNTNSKSPRIDVFELACFEGATSRTLLETLELIMAKVQNSSCNDEREPLLMISNMELIRAEDKWQTRTFVELLRHVVTCSAYYDSQLELRSITNKLRIAVVTRAELKPAGHYARLVSLARSGVQTIDAQANGRTPVPRPPVPLSLEELVDWCRRRAPSSNSATSLEYDRLILLLESGDQFQTDINLLAKLAERLNSSKDLELCRFNNSSGTLKSLELLNNLIGQTGSRRRPVLLLDWVQLSLLDDVLKARLYHLLNLIMLRARLGIDAGDLRCLFVYDEASQINQSDLLFWQTLNQCNMDLTSQLDFRHFKFQPMIESPISNLGSNIEAVLLIEGTSGKCKYCTSQSSLKWLIPMLEQYFNYEDANISKRATERQQAIFLKTFSKMASTLGRHAESQRALLATGLGRLAEFDSSVESIKAARRAEEVSLASRQREIESLLAKINKVIANGRARAEQLAGLRQRQEVKARELGESRARIEIELANVMPLIEAGKRDISQCLKAEALNEIRSLRAPPATIKDILDVLFVLLLASERGANSNSQQQQPGDSSTMQPPSWSEMKSYLARNSLRDELVKFDFQARLTDGRLLARLEREISARSESFRLDQAERASSAVVPIVKWIQAALEYGRALVRVKPLTDGIGKLQDEHDQLERSMDTLEREQRDLDERTKADQRQLAKLEDSYRKARGEADEARLDVERAHKIRANLVAPVERWRQKLARLERLLANSGRELIQACLICTSLALNVHNSDELILEIKTWLELGQSETIQQLAADSEQSLAQTGNGLIQAFARLYLSPVIDCINGTGLGDTALPVQFESNFETLSSMQLDHLLRLFICKLNLHFNAHQLLHLHLNQSQLLNDELVRYLNHAHILSPQNEDLVCVRSTRTHDWRQEARMALDSGRNKLLLIEVPPQAPLNKLKLLEIFDFFLGELGNEFGSNRVILYSEKSRLKLNAEMPSDFLLKYLDIGGESDKTQRDSPIQPREFQQLVTEMTDCLVDWHEPEVAASITEAELELGARRVEVARQETNLMINLRSAMANDGETKPGAALDSKSGLVRLLIDLNESSESLAASIAIASNKLRALQAKRDKFQPLATRLATFYANHLASLKSIDHFYRLTPRGLVRLKRRLDDCSCEEQLVGLVGAAIERAMCSMRPNHRLDLERSLEICQDTRANCCHLERAAVQASARRAANLRQSLLRLVVDLACGHEYANGDKWPSSACETPVKLAIILHDSRKSSPQMEVDELFARQQGEIYNWLALDKRDNSAEIDCKYYKLYATNDDKDGAIEAELTQTTASPIDDHLQHNSASKNQLEWQLERVLSGDLSSPSSVARGTVVDRAQQLRLAATQQISENHEDNNDDSSTREVVVDVKQRARCGGTPRKRQLILKCICVANAHLAARWINTRLLELLWKCSSGKKSGAGGDKLQAEQRILVVLVGERDEQQASGANHEGEDNVSPSADFNPNLIDEASLRFWYDELGLEPHDRYQLYRQLLQTRTGKGRGQDLIDRLVLFHVICQELTRTELWARVEGVTLWSKGQDYHFDYELLSLALNIVDHEIQQTGEQAGLDVLCDQLEFIVYGARMETEVDEQLLHGLISGYLRSAESGRRKVAEFEKCAGAATRRAAIGQLLRAV